MGLALAIIICCPVLVYTGDSHTQFADDSSLTWAVRMAESEMTRFPQAWMVDFNKSPKWNYTQGLIITAFARLWEITRNDKYFNYIKEYVDTFVDDEGHIRNYKLEDYNIDKINAGRGLLFLFRETREERYKKAAFLLRSQFRTHPRTSEGGFWHKKRYPHQIWLDGIYMGTPFYTEFGKMFQDSSCFDDACHQIILAEKHLRDPESGLLYHGWDESKQQRWADPKTGLSDHFWGRGIGWYAMAIVDVLDYLPPEHTNRGDLIAILNRLVVALEKYRDPESGVWYQVMDQGKREGNYLESTASTMFVYTLIKAVRKGYIDSHYEAVGRDGMKGIMQNFITINSQGLLNVNQCCAGAGLGGKPYRDGSYNYYITTKIRSNDPKAVGPLIMALLEFAAAEEMQQK